jgi:hypothetical protein
MRLAPAARKLALTLACLLPLAGAPATAPAQEVEIEHDGRREGYGEKMVMDGGNNAMTWLGFGLLAVISLLALFKDAKRSHLD